MVGVTASTVGISSASANLFRSLGGSIGTAAFGAVFALHSVQTVFPGAAPVAIAGLLVVLPARRGARSAAPQP